MLRTPCLTAEAARRTPARARLPVLARPREAAAVARTPTACFILGCLAGGVRRGLGAGARGWGVGLGAGLGAGARFLLENGLTLLAHDPNLRAALLIFLVAVATALFTILLDCATIFLTDFLARAVTFLTALISRLTTRTIFSAALRVARPVPMTALRARSAALALIFLTELRRERPTEATLAAIFFRSFLIHFFATLTAFLAPL
mmetsp:Transcript_35182/g.80251  ORF Transcript_35182/g.80251 Transcript_35182/m.80251 type:complete len:205 (+) Transcript_35182:1004-1618(+)